MKDLTYRVEELLISVGHRKQINKLSSAISLLQFLLQLSTIRTYFPQQLDLLRGIGYSYIHRAL
jgi:hypothetical protein